MQWLAWGNPESQSLCRELHVLSRLKQGNEISEDEVLVFVCLFCCVFLLLFWSFVCLFACFQIGKERSGNFQCAKEGILQEGRWFFFLEYWKWKINILEGSWGKEKSWGRRNGKGEGRSGKKMPWSTAPLDLLAEKQRESWDCMDSVCVLLSLCLRPSSTELPSPVERGGASMAGN